MTSAEIVLGFFQSAFAIYAGVFLLTSFGAPSFYLRYLSLNEIYEKKHSKWRIWSQGAITVIAVGVLVYAASYAMIAAIPYDWGYHDEDGEWSASRDTIRFLVTVVGTFYLSFSLDRVARSVLLIDVERKTRSALLRTLSQSFEVSSSALKAAIENVERELKIDDDADRTWAVERQERFKRAVTDELEAAMKKRKLLDL